MIHYFTYVLYSPKYDKIYVGHSDNQFRRLGEHNDGKSRYTKIYIPWELIYSEKFNTRAEAMKREKQLKSHSGRDFIRKNLLNGGVRQLPD